MNIELIRKEDVTEDRTFVTNFYRPRILLHTEEFKRLIEQSGGKVTIKTSDPNVTWTNGVGGCALHPKSVNPLAKAYGIVSFKGDCY
jgi:hypothetical protein